MYMCYFKKKFNYYFLKIKRNEKKNPVLVLKNEICQILI